MSSCASPRDVGIFFGRPVRSHLLAEELRGRGFSVTLYNNQGVPGTYVAVRMAFVPAFRHLLTTHHQIYVTSFCFVPAMCLYLNRLVRGIPYVFNAVGWMPATYRLRAGRLPLAHVLEDSLYPALTNRILGGASSIVCNSQYLQRRLERAFPHYAQKMVTIYNGIEFEKFAAGKRIHLEGVSPDARTLLAVMTWDHEAKASGARLLIEAMGPISRAFPTTRLVLAAKAKHRRFAQEIEQFLATVPWKDCITILYNQTNIPDLLASSELFVYATPADSNDSLPRALLEAHAAGLPIVATATAGCPEVVEHSVTGFLTSYTAQSLSERIIELLHDPSKGRDMGRRGQDRVRRLFSWEQMADAYAAVFRHIKRVDGRPCGTKRVHSAKRQLF